MAELVYAYDSKSYGETHESSILSRGTSFAMIHRSDIYSDMNRHELPTINNNEDYPTKELKIDVLTDTTNLPEKLKQLGWPLELQGGGKTTSEKSMNFELTFPVGDIFLSYITTIHELGHLRQESLDPSLDSSHDTYEVLYAQEQDAWNRGWSRFIKANPDLIENLKEKFEIYKSQGKLEFNSFESLYKWVRENSLKMVESQKKLYKNPTRASLTKSEKDDIIIKELEKEGKEIKQFFTDYKASRVGEAVEETEIRQAIINTVEQIRNE